MISKSIDSSQTARREAIARSLQQCRLGTLQQFEGIDESTFCTQAHPDFSPAGWHLGHIGLIEATWLLQPSAELNARYPSYRRLFAADGLPKTERGKLPSLDEICEYLAIVRHQVRHALTTASMTSTERLWRFILQHESQHSETIAMVLALQAGFPETDSTSPLTEAVTDKDRAIEIPAGWFEQGNNAIDAMDNERQPHRRYLDTYRIDKYPVTCGEYRQFIESGGYGDRRWWSDAGWQWLQVSGVSAPLYWRDEISWRDRPVCAVSWYEAEAYARFVGKRLPTEAEWTKAASWDPIARQRRIYPWGNEPPSASRCNWDRHWGQITPVNAFPEGASVYGCYDMLGNVWEWTASWFGGYEGFQFYPYRGYSEAFFDRQHRVLRGGSWATRSWALRCSFRNWYYPHVRQVFAGFRCVDCS